MCFGASTLVTPEPSKAGGRAQFIKSRASAARGVNGLIQLGRNCLTGSAFRPKQLGFYALHFRRTEVFAMRLAMASPSGQVKTGSFQFSNTNKAGGAIHSKPRGRDHYASSMQAAHPFGLQFDPRLWVSI
jgi:hypothetical protein